jgi:hypothetical protein
VELGYSTAVEVVNFYRLRFDVQIALRPPGSSSAAGSYAGMFVL